MTDAAARTVRTHSDGPKWFASLTRIRLPWSKVAAFRALRATLVIPALFALTSHVIDNTQMTLFATFGGFATLVLASFAGNRPQKLAAHIALGVVGSMLIPLGTVVSGTAAAAALVALPVVFGVIYAGATGWNAANGSAAALLSYILPAASPGTVDMIPSRLAGWWLATAAGTLAVLVLSPRPGPSPLRRAVSTTANVVAKELDAALDGVVDSSGSVRIDAASRDLTAAFTAAPYRPTGLAIADQAVAHLVESLQWCAALVSDLLSDGVLSPTRSALSKPDRQRFEASGRVLGDVGRVLAGSPATSSLQQLDSPERQESREFEGAGPEVQHETAHGAFYASVLVEGVRAVAASALVVTGASPTDFGEPRAGRSASRWLHAAGIRARARIAAAGHDLRGQLSLRSVWVRNAARGAVAIAAAIAIADLTNVQHGFWVVLGTLAVLRTNAASTGANAWWAVLGTVGGVLIGAGLVLGIGVGSAALWAAFVVAVVVAAYAPGVLPFPIGQAAFSVMLLVLYNIIAPVGWQVGVVRLEDIGIGVGVSTLVGVLFWPRGAVAAVAEDLADTLHRCGIYLVQACSWALATRPAPPDGVAALQASARLDDATRSLLAEQSAKRTPKEVIWTLVGAAMRLRLTAASLAAAAQDGTLPDRTRFVTLHESLQIAGECDDLAAKLGHVDATVVRELAGVVPILGGPGLGSTPRLVWVQEHLEHARGAVLSMAEPASVVVKIRRTPWWRGTR